MMTATALSSFTVLMLLASAGRHVKNRPVAASSVEDQPARIRSTRQRPLLIAFGAVASVLLLGPVITVAVALGFLAWPHVQRIARQRRERAAVIASLPDAIEMLILVVRSGMTPHQAVAMLADRAPSPVRPAFVEVGRRRARGATLADALRALPDLIGPAANIVADTLAMAERYGTPITEALEQLSVDVRERRVRQAEADARKLPIRMSFPLVICTLPSFVLVAIVPAVLGALASLEGSAF